MQAVLGLIEHNRAMRFHYLVRHFLAALGRQTVHEDGVGMRFCEQRVIDLERGERRGPRFSFALLTHAGPHIGIDRIGAVESLCQIASNSNPA